MGQYVLIKIIVSLNGQLNYPNINWRPAFLPMFTYTPYKQIVSKSLQNAETLYSGGYFCCT